MSQFELYVEENGSKTLLTSNINQTILTAGITDLGINTEKFGRTFSVYLRNKKYYGSTSLTNELKLNFIITGCDYVPMIFNP